MNTERYLDELLGPVEPPEFFPTIIVDSSLGEHLSNISVDLEAINKTFLENGLTEDQINATTIVFSGKMPRISREGAVTQGDYKEKKWQLNNYPARRIQQRLKGLEESEGDDRTFQLEKMGKYLGWAMGETLRHEMEHHIVHVHGGMPEQKKLDRRHKAEFAGITTAMTAGTMAVASAYESLNPSETVGQIITSQSIIVGLLTSIGVYAMARRHQHYYKISPEEERARKSSEKDFFYVKTHFKAQEE